MDPERAKLTWELRTDELQGWSWPRHGDGDGPVAAHGACPELGEVEDKRFFQPVLARLQREVARQLGYELVDHRLELYGTPLNKKGVAAEDG